VRERDVSRITLVTRRAQLEERVSVGPVVDHLSVDVRGAVILRAPSEMFSCIYLALLCAYLGAVINALDQWFATEILPHEGALVRYLTRVWPNRSEVLDLRQDIYVRVYESARTALPTTPKAFLFAAARNLMTDRIRHNRIVLIDSRQDFEGLNVLVDELSPERCLSARQELRNLARAFDSLSEKCRNVIWLRRVEGLSQRQTAQRLGLREGAVESQLARGVRVLARAMLGAPDDTDPQSESSASEHESRHP